MKANFVLESFDDYVKEMYPTINEFDEYQKLRPLTIEEARAIVSELTENQGIRALANTKVRGLIVEIFGLETLKVMKQYPLYWAPSMDKKQKEDFFKKVVEFDSRL